MPVELLPETPSQTAGPYVHIGLALEAAGNPPREQEIWNEMAKPGAPGSTSCYWAMSMTATVT